MLWTDVPSCGRLRVAKSVEFLYYLVIVVDVYLFFIFRWHQCPLCGSVGTNLLASGSQWPLVAMFGI